MLKFRFFNQFLRVAVAVSLVVGIVAAGSAHPRQAEANPAVAVPIAVGSVVATALAIYGIQSVTTGHSVEDVGNDFMTWLNSSEAVASYLEARDWTREYVVNQLYYTYNTSTLLFSEFFGADSGHIRRAWLLELLTMFAAENFGSGAASEIVTYGDFTFNTFSSDIPSHGFGIGTSASSGLGSYPLFGFFYSSNELVYVSNGAFRGTSPVLFLDDYGGWAISESNPGGNSYILSVFTTAGSLSSSPSQVLLNSYYYPDVSASDIFLNSYYDIAIIHTTYNINSVAAAQNSNARVPYTTSQGFWSASTGTWSGDVTVSLPDNIDYGLFGDAAAKLGHTAADVLGKYFPLGSDMVYNPTADNALENAGSVPIINDFSLVDQWADVLSGERAGLLDPSITNEGELDGDASRVITSDIASSTVIDASLIDVDSIPWTPFSDTASLPPAIGFAGGQMLDRFPFCTIRDLQLLADFMNTPSSAPYFDLPLVVVSDGSLQVVTQRVSLSEWEPVAVVLRFMIGLLIILGFLRVATRQLKIFNEE